MCVYNSGNFVSICKLGTGFSQELLAQITERLSKNAINLDSETYNFIFPNNARPNIFFKPTEVWEVGFDSFTISSAYTVGRGLFHKDSNNGLSIRFPRFLRYREDKKVNEADSEMKIIEMYKSQVGLI